MVVTPADLYEMEPQMRSFEIYDAFRHIPEVFESWDLSEANQSARRVERRTLRYVDYDGRRFWELAAIYFDGNPVMLTQNAGREGDDHSRRFITDTEAYGAMVGYLTSLGDVDRSDVIDPMAARDDLTEFYGDNLIGR